MALSKPKVKLAVLLPSMQRNKSFAARQHVKSISERRKFTITQVYILVLAPVSDIFPVGRNWAYSAWVANLVFCWPWHLSWHEKIMEGLTPSLPFCSDSAIFRKEPPSHINLRLARFPRLVSLGRQFVNQSRRWHGSLILRVSNHLYIGNDGPYCRAISLVPCLLSFCRMEAW